MTYLINLQGIDRVARRSLLLHRLATIDQPAWLPRLPPRLIHQGLSGKAYPPMYTKAYPARPLARCCSGSPRRAGGWTSWSQDWPACSTLPGCRSRPAWKCSIWFGLALSSIWSGFQSNFVWFGFQLNLVWFGFQPNLVRFGFQSNLVELSQLSPI